MIGHYLLSLTPEQEDRVLTIPFGGRGQGCLCMLVSHSMTGANMAEFNSDRVVPGILYEYLLRRFGVERVNVAIRNRILSNRARRTLRPVDTAAVR